MKTHKETKYYYWVEVPIFEKYEDIEVDDYCESCGNIEGTRIEKQGINLLGYEWKRFKKGPFYEMGMVMDKILWPKIVDELLSSPLWTKITGNKIDIPSLEKNDEKENN